MSKELGTPQRHGGTTLSPSAVVRLYVCPRCANYFGSSGMGHLERQKNVAVGGSPDPGSVVSRRSRCPNCGAEREERYARLVGREEQAEAKKAAKR